MKRAIRSVIPSFVLLLLSASVSAADKPGHAAIASAHSLATAAGFEVLQKGGNAFDAAIAVSSTLAVVEPTSSGIGGGGFWLLHRASDGKDIMVDAREIAPAGAKAEQYLDAQGKLIPERSVNGVLAAAIPGEPAGLVWLAKNYGKLPLKDSLAPAIRIARNGFPADQKYRQMLGYRRDVMAKDAEAAKIFLRDAQVPAPDTLLKNADLADTLELIAAQGNDGFYKGKMAKTLVDGVNQRGGHWSLDDFAAYQVKEREPIRTRYRDYDIVTVPPSSSGGIALVEMFNILSGFDWAKADHVARVHLLTEAMRRAYRDRTLYLGDSDFVKVPLAMLSSPYYADGLRASIRTDKATPSAMLPGLDAVPGGTDTTHFSLIDADGNMVAATLTVNLPYGACVVIPGTGFLLNNEMDDFAIKAGTANAFGLLGDKANAIEPHKRPLSSMTPSFVTGKDRVAVIGTPGGSRIITMVLLGILDFIDGKDAQAIVTAPRIHHQYLPDVIGAEKGALTRDEVKALEALGHTVNEGERTWGNMNVVTWDKTSGKLGAASDPRGLVGKGEVR